MEPVTPTINPVVEPVSPVEPVTPVINPVVEPVSPVEPVTPAINPVVEPVSPVEPVEQNGVEQSNISMANNVNNSSDLSQKKDNDSLEVFGLD